MSLVSIATKALPALPIVKEYSSLPHGIPQGEHASTLELFLRPDRSAGLVEWDIPTLGETAHIGVWFKGRTLRDYDGVFELPAEVVAFLREQGFIISADFDPSADDDERTAQNREQASRE